MARSTTRDLNKEALWRRRVHGQTASGLSIRAWCRKHAVRESVFYWWRSQLARRHAVARIFVPVQVSPESSPAPASVGQIEIVLAGDRCVRVVGPVDRQALADVLVVVADHASAAEAREC